MLKQLKQLSTEGIIRPLDYQFARFLHSLCDDPILSLFSALVSYELGQGNACLDLNRWQSSSLFCNHSDHDQVKIFWDSVRQHDQVKATGLTAYLLSLEIVSDGTTPAPLVTDNGYLYLYRYWLYETNVAHFLSNNKILHLNVTRANSSLNQLFSRNYAALLKQCQARKSDKGIRQTITQWLNIHHPDDINWTQIIPCIRQATIPDDLQKLDRLIPEEQCLDWQKIAVASAISHSFSVISGGPGTGKTTTVTRLLALLAQLDTINKHAPIIKLVAPTGKAAARLTESMTHALEHLLSSAAQDNDIYQVIPRQAETVHRLLGVRMGKPGFIHGRDNPLHLDILVVDEASMIDLPLMSALLDALPSHARLILLGDHHQLASVEAGSVLGDICAGAANNYSQPFSEQLNHLTGFVLPNTVNQHKSVVQDAICLLQKSYRFSRSSGIGTLAYAINRGDYKTASDVFSAGFNDIALHDISDHDYSTLIHLCAQAYLPYIIAIQQQLPPKDILRKFRFFRLLCALRDGKFGVSMLNKTIEEQLEQQQLINREYTWYEGRPVMITRNDHAQGLYNGDIGIAIKSPDGKLRINFDQPDGSLKQLLPSRMPEHETVFAMTVHKSQGSEFSHTAMILPDTMNQVLTRELIYTGITRARQHLDLFCTQSVLRQSIKRLTQRTSGLGHRLQKR
ncbi:RecBCD enzyme subunit RecD [invertebrate metagenome]|uniref:RecBCD enzyme subunit RecD n=1 Tax=invertebrate metagenome TaxID=1711999 RepID=A0A2H9T884_9ZZZZ